MELESNLNEISLLNRNLTRRKLTFIGTGVLFATAICISVIVTVSVNSSSNALSTKLLTSFTVKMNLIKDEIKWVSYNSENYSLTNAFAGGTGANGKTVYVCRAKHLSNNGKDEEVIPGTFDPADAVCKVPYGDYANSHREFELLVTKNPSLLVWQTESDGRLRNGAISGGHTAYNKELYITRFQYQGYTVLGELYLPRGKASGPIGRDQGYRKKYDLLCVADYAM